MISHPLPAVAPSPDEVVHPKIKRELKTKILIGVGSTNSYLPVLDLLGRLQLPEPDITLLHAVDTRNPLANADPARELEYAKVMQNIGARILTLAKTEAESRKMEVKTEMVFGRAADCLKTKADQDNSELISICAIKHGAWSAGYVGSAACALALNASQSLLVAKTPLKHTGPLRVVLGIDHSTKVNGLLQSFVDLAPQGIDEILVLTAYEIDDETAQATHENLVMLGGDIDRSLQALFTEKNAKIVDLLSESGYRSQSKVLNAAPTDALRATMNEFRADLLIIGEIGDGGAVGSKIGSVALHQIISEPYSVLMLRG